MNNNNKMLRHYSIEKNVIKSIEIQFFIHQITQKLLNRSDTVL